MIVYLGRHGQSEANVLRVFSNGLNKHGLTEKGRSQARLLGERFREKQIEGLYSSPILRAIQTSEIVSKVINKPFQVVSALAEFSVGEWEGKGDEVLWEEHHSLFEKWLIKKDFTASNGRGENYLDIQRRFLPFIYHLVSAHSEKGDFLLIGHGGTTIAMLPCLTQDLSPQEILCLDFKNTAVICLEWHENTFHYLGME